MKLTSSPIPALFAFLKILFHVLTIATFGFHRDELLYLSLGRHLDWGYWSNPPFIGAVTWLSQNILGDSVWATRLPSVLCGGLLVWLVVRMARELGGGVWAQVLCGAAMLLSPAWLRMNSMLQPVPFDVLFWALSSFCVVRWLNTRDPRWWLWLGVAVGIGFLNKYTLAFWVIGLLIALLLTPERRSLVTRQPWQAAGIALLILLPNLIWQCTYHFPVLHHMQELSRNQLANVQPFNFLLDQVFLHGTGVLLWMAGLLFLLFAKAMQPYRMLGWFYIAVVLVLLFLGGKSYYTAGAYPVLFAAGGVFWGKILQRNWQRLLLIGVMVGCAWPLVPAGIPLYSGEKAVAYFRWLSQDLGLDGVTRWEDGKPHPLPQDFADMLGWPELADLTDRAVAQAGGNSNCVVYGENYGQAGAAAHLSHSGQTGALVLSFSDAWRLWLPDTLPAQNLVYINDEMGEDVQRLFGNIQLIGKIENPLAREYGTGVWLCREPRSSLQEFWGERVREVRAVFMR